MRNSVKKQDLIDAFVNEHSDCGKIHYFDFECDESYFEKYLKKKKKSELIEMLFNYDSMRAYFFNFFVSIGALDEDSKKYYQENCPTDFNKFLTNS